MPVPVVGAVESSGGGEEVHDAVCLCVLEEGKQVSHLRWAERRGMKLVLPVWCCYFSMLGLRGVLCAWRGGFGRFDVLHEIAREGWVQERKREKRQRRRPQIGLYNSSATPSTTLSSFWCSGKVPVCCVWLCRGDGGRGETPQTPLLTSLRHLRQSIENAARGLAMSHVYPLRAPHVAYSSWGRQVEAPLCDVVVARSSRSAVYPFPPPLPPSPLL